MKLWEVLNDDDWTGWPELGTRVRVPHGNSSIEGVVTSRYRVLGEQVAIVRIRRCVSSDPDVFQAFNVPFEREALEIVSEPALPSK